MCHEGIGKGAPVAKGGCVPHEAEGGVDDPDVTGGRSDSRGGTLIATDGNMQGSDRDRGRSRTD